MSQRVVGTENLAKRVVITDLIPVTVDGQQYYVARTTDGMNLGINDAGNVYHGPNIGAWEVCRPNADRTLLYFKHGVVSYGEGWPS